MRIKDLQFNTDQEACLSGEAISEAEPGSVLRDFRMLLDFVGADGVAAGGAYNLLPIKSIAELDRRLSRPLNLELKRPQLKSHPYLQGLHLLLRASGLGVIQGAGPKARLFVEPGDARAVEPAQPHRAILQPAGSMAPVRPIGDRRRPARDV